MHKPINFKSYKQKKLLESIGIKLYISNILKYLPKLIYEDSNKLVFVGNRRDYNILKKDKFLEVEFNTGMISVKIKS